MFKPKTGLKSNDYKVKWNTAVSIVEETLRNSKYSMGEHHTDNEGISTMRLQHETKGGVGLITIRAKGKPEIFFYVRGQEAIAKKIATAFKEHAGYFMRPKISYSLYPLNIPTV